MNKFIRRTLIILSLFVFAFGTSFSPVNSNVFAAPGGTGAAVELSVDKFDVTPDYNIVYEWTLTKSASPTLLQLAAGGSGDVTYTVSAVKTLTSTFSLTYNVTVLNKGPGDIRVDIVTSIQNPSGSFVHVTETVENDLTVANGATFTKKYTTSFAVVGNVGDITPLKVVVELADMVNVGNVKISGTQAAINFKETPTSVFNETLTVTDSWAGAGPWTFTDTGSVQYTRTFNAGAIGDVLVNNTVTSNTLQHHDPAVLTSQAQVTVRTINSAPIADPDSFTVNEGGTKNGTLTGSDPDGQSITFFEVTGPVNGSLIINENGTYTYIHDGSETTSDSFTFRVFDGTLYSPSATVTITVTPVNDAPTANPDSFTVNEGGTFNGTLTGSDPEDDELTFSVVDQPMFGSLTINADGTFTYIHDGSETVADSFTFRVYDGQLYSTGALVRVTINSVNDAPVADPDSFTVDEGATHNGTLTGSDPEDDELTFFVVDLPVNGSLIINEDGTFTYIHDGSETVSDSFTFRVFDGEFYSEKALVSITVTPVNDAPVADNDAFEVDQGQEYTDQLTGSDAEDDELEFILVDGPLYGVLVLNADGTYSYTHDNSENYEDSFTFKVNDGMADSNVATVTILINATLPDENAAPIADDSEFDVDQGEEYNGMVTGSDEDDDEITFILVDGPAYGVLVFNADGTFTYTHDDSENYEDSFTFKVNDGEADSDVATVTILINATLPDTSDNNSGFIGFGALALGLILLLFSKKKEAKN
jgi:LPXTG-motif cell wall-anchored protein